MHQDYLAYHSYAVVWVLNCSDAYNNNDKFVCICLTILVEVGPEKLLQMFFAPLAAVVNVHIYSV